MWKQRFYTQHFENQSTLECQLAPFEDQFGQPVILRIDKNL